MKYGYARSAQEKWLQLQVDELKKKNLNEIIDDRTGEKLQDLIDSLKPGDSIHVTTLDRISRSSSQFVKIAERLLDNDIGLYIGGNRIEKYDIYAIGALGEAYKRDTLKMIEHHKAWKEKQKEAE